MTQVDFYVLPKDGSLTLAQAIGRIAEKAVSKGHRVFIHAADKTEAADIQRGLWTFRPQSFLPSALLESHDEELVAIGWAEPRLDHDDVLLNVTGAVPGYFSRFRRLAEIVPQDEAKLAASRDAWRFYRDRGYPLAKHDL